MVRMNEVKNKYSIIYWDKKFKDRVYVIGAETKKDKEYHIARLKDCDLNYIVTENLGKKRSDGDTLVYKIESEGFYPNLKRMKMFYELLIAGAVIAIIYFFIKYFYH